MTARQGMFRFIIHDDGSVELLDRREQDDGLAGLDQREHRDDLTTARPVGSSFVRRLNAELGTPRRGDGEAS